MPADAWRILRISGSSASVAPFLAMEIMERAQRLERDGVDVVHMEVGEPDFDVPECVRRAADEAARAGHTHYTHSLGLWDLRLEIAAYYARRYGVRVAPERVIVTSGTSGGLTLLMALLLDAGDEVLLPDPGYACYPNFVRAFHGVPRFFPVDAAFDYVYEPDVIRRELTPRTRGLMVNSPSNPTAAIQGRETMAALAEEFAGGHAGGDARAPLVVSDEIYHGLEYDAQATSMLQVTDRCFVLDGFSKRYAMTGWRIGWLVAPGEYVPTLQRLQQNLFICPGSVAQHAGLAALRGADAEVAAMRDEYARRRSVLLAGLRRLGFGVPAEPMGAYYVLADARHLDTDSVRLAHRLLEEAHVGVCPGADFGSRGEGHLRFSFASALPRITAGLDRLESWLGGA